MVDRVVTPPDSVGRREYYRTPLVYLPHTYQPQDELSDRMAWVPGHGHGHGHGKRQSGVSTEGGIVQEQEQEQVYPGALEYASLSGSVVSDFPTRTLLRQYLMHKYRLPRVVVTPQEGAAGSIPSIPESIPGRSYELWFICFNRIEKVTPDVFEDWMQVLRQAPRVTLVLQATNANETSMLYAYAAYYGVHANRILLFPKLVKKDYSILLGLADLFLDTRYYNAHTIATDAMYRHTPVLTLVGNSFASRVGCCEALG